MIGAFFLYFSNSGDSKKLSMSILDLKNTTTGLLLALYLSIFLTIS
jgi:hypothetical protein